MINSNLTLLKWYLDGLDKMVSRRAPDRGGKLQSAGGGGAAQSNVSPLAE